MSNSDQNKESAIVKKAISGESWNEFCDLLKAAGQFVVDN